MRYPATRTVEQIDDYFGTSVTDPYRWLERPSTDPEIAAWVAEQWAAARAVLDELPGRDRITASVSRLMSLPSTTAPHRHGALWFRYTRDGVAEQPVLRAATSPMADGVVLIDPNPLTEGSTTSIADAVPSPDGTLVAYSYREAGSDRMAWRVRRVVPGRDGGEDLPDLVEDAKFTSVAWSPDGASFFYGGFPPSAGHALVESGTGHQLRRHVLGTTTDEVVLALPGEPEVMFDPEVTDDDRWLVVSADRGTDPTNRLFVCDLTDPDAAPRLLVDRDDASWRVVGCHDGRLLVRTDLDAPRGRLVTVDPTDTTGRPEPVELVAERRASLVGAHRIAGGLLLHWLSDAHSELTVHALDGTELRRVDLPFLGSVDEIAARHDDGMVHLRISSFTTPGVVLALDTATGATTSVFRPDAGIDEPVTDQVWLDSADGTPVPMFLVHRTDVTAATGPHPTLLWGYGGFGIPITPSFNAARAAFVAAGGVLAVPNLRGGGEFGRKWHDAGRLQNKQNVFDDALAAARHLTAAGWADPTTLACNGGSNGGLLVGALVTQAPELFAAAVCEVGVLDLLRFRLFTIGWAWTSDYGDPAASPEEFRTAYAYSPLHRVRPGIDYPPTLIMTSDHDDRVVPAHSYKFAAALQAAGGGGPALLRVEIDSGHGAGRARSATVAERTDMLAFVAAHTGLAWP